MFNKIKLECPCGAKLEMEFTFDVTAESIYAEWKKEHQGHEAQHTDSH